jgi:hypothetical protein
MSAKPIADCQINLLGEFRAADFAGFAAHSLYRQRAAGDRDDDLFADADNLARLASVWVLLQPGIEEAQNFAMVDSVRARLGIAAAALLFAGEWALYRCPCPTKKLSNRSRFLP